MYYWCAVDSHASRRVLPWTFLTVAIVNLLIFGWVCIYILCIYDKDKVYWPTYNKDDESETGALAINYNERKKAYYIFYHVLMPFFMVFIFGAAFIWSKEWVDKHAKQ